MITQKQLKDALRYNKNTGAFAWKKGETAGYVCKTHGYIFIGLNYEKHPAHRLAWLYEYGEFPDNHIDHINHVRSDNRIANLRVVSPQGNHKNRSLSPKNKSGITGVSRHKPSGIWQAMIKSDGRQTYLGSSKDKFEAICLRKSAENRLGFHQNHGKTLDNLQRIEKGGE